MMSLLYLYEGISIHYYCYMGLNIFNKLIKTITIKEDVYKKLTLVAYLKVSMIILTTLNHKKGAR